MCRLLGRSSGPIHLINVDGTSRAAGSHERGSWRLRCSPQEPYIKFSLYKDKQVSHSKEAFEAVTIYIHQ